MNRKTTPATSKISKAFDLGSLEEIIQLKQTNQTHGILYLLVDVNIHTKHVLELNKPITD